MNPPPTFLQNTHIHTHTHLLESWLLYPYKPQWKSKNIPTQRLSTSLWLNKHTRQYADAQSAAERQCEHNHTSPHCPWASSRWEKQKWKWGGKRSNRQKWEEEMGWREAGDDKWEDLDYLTVMALKRGCFVSSASLLLMESTILPSVPQTHSLIRL